MVTVQIPAVNFILQYLRQFGHSPSVERWAIHCSHCRLGFVARSG